MKLACLALVCGVGLTWPANAAEVLHYTLVRGSTITPGDGGGPIGLTEPLSGRFDWVLYDQPITRTIIAFNAVALSFHSTSFALELNTTPVNDVMSAVHTDSTLTVFDEVADLSGLASSPGSLMCTLPGSYLGPPTRPVVLNYPEVMIGPVGAGRWLAKLTLVAVMDGVLNVAPSFTKGPDLTVLQNCGPQTAVRWATSISPGPPNESWQTLTFVATTDNRGLFSAPPALTPDGTLTFTPALNRSGVASVTVILHDNGGTQYGGEDTSEPQTFTITVLSPCQAVQQLGQSVIQTDLGHINKRPMLTSLREACFLFDRGQWWAGINHLRAFQNKVRAQVARSHPEVAEQWIAEAQDIINIFSGAFRAPGKAPAVSSPASE